MPKKVLHNKYGKEVLEEKGQTAPEWIRHWETTIRKKAERKTEEFAQFYSKNK